MINKKTIYNNYLKIKLSTVDSLVILGKKGIKIKTTYFFLTLRTQPKLSKINI